MSEYPIFAQKLITIDSQQINLFGDVSMDDPLTLPADPSLLTTAGDNLISYPGTQNFFAGSDSGNTTLTGAGNTGIGYNSGNALTTANNSTFLGAGSGSLITSGANNTACGGGSLNVGTTAFSNSCFGTLSGSSLTTGNGNTLIGKSSGSTLTTATGNTFIGLDSGSALAAVDSNNILIASPGVSGDSATIRIGSSQTTAYVAGISGVTSAGAVAAVINADGKFGTVVSSRKRKRDIQDVVHESQKLKKVRIVQFKMIDDPTDELQYGAIAEDVAPIMPECIAYTDVKKEFPTIQYNKWIPLLVKITQDQQMEIDDLKQQIVSLKSVS